MPPKDIIRLYNLIKSGEFDFIKTYKIIRYDGFYRKTTSIIFNLILKILFLGTLYRDINSKPNYGSAIIFKPVSNKTIGFAN